METEPDAEVRYPPASVRFPFTVSALGPLVSPPEEMVSEETVTGDANETFRAMIKVARAGADPSAIVPEAGSMGTGAEPAVSTEDDPEVFHEPDTEIDPVVKEMEFVPASFIVTEETRIDDAVPIRLPPPEIVRLAPPVMLFPEVVSVPVTDSEPRTSSAVFCVMVPEMTRLLNPLFASRVATLAEVPDIVTVLAPEANVEPAPDVSHCPLTIQDPLVRVSDPEAPPVIVTSVTATLDAFAMRAPELPTPRDPPVRERFDVARVVDEPTESWMTRRPLHRSPFTVIVKVIVPLPAVDWNVTSWNSLPARFANVSVCEDGESKITRPDPGSQFVEVLLLDQEPPTVQTPRRIRT